MIIKVLNGTTNLNADPTWSELPNQEVYIECDSTLGAIILNLPSIAAMGGFLNAKFYISDVSGSAAAHSITVNTGDRVNGVIAPLIISQAYGSISLAIVNSNGYFGVSSAVAAPVVAYPLGAAAEYVILTPAALTIGLAAQPLVGSTGELEAIKGTPVYISGSDNPAPVSNAAVTAAAALYTQLTTLTPTYSFAPGAVVLDTVDVGFGAGNFRPGIYFGAPTAAAGTGASGVVVFDGDGDYVFYFDGAITTGANTRFELVNGAKASRIFFASSAALTTGAGTIWKGTSVSPAGQTTGADNNFEGRLLSTVAAITTGAGAQSIYLPTA
jgi:hypothetical protein